MHSFEVQSNDSACRKIGRLGLDQVYIDKSNYGLFQIVNKEEELIREKLHQQYEKGKILLLDQSPSAKRGRFWI